MSAHRWMVFVQTFVSVRTSSREMHWSTRACLHDVLTSLQFYMKDAVSAETIETLIFRFLVLEILSFCTQNWSIFRWTSSTKWITTQKIKIGKLIYNSFSPLGIFSVNFTTYELFFGYYYFTICNCYYRLFLRRGGSLKRKENSK